MEDELAKAIHAHARDNHEETARHLARAQERHDRFVLHGMIPEDLTD
jgi:hypothetical protein